MAKDILLMGYIGQYQVLYFFEQIKEALKENPEEELILRANTEGGSPDYMMSIMEKVQELSNQITIKGGSQMHSSGFFAMCYVPKERVEVADVTQAVLHRAAYPSWLEKSPEFPGSSYDITMSKTNRDLEKAVRARVDVEVLESLPQFKEKNLTLKDVFSKESRIDIVLSGSDLKKIGLASKVNKITPSRQAELNAEIEIFKQCNSLEELRTAASLVSADSIVTTKTENNKIMDLQELKSKHPDVYAQALAEGKTAGKTEESDRVRGWEAFRHIDAEAVTKGIQSGKTIGPADIAEFSAKAVSPEYLKKIAASSAAPLTTTEAQASATPKTDDEKTLDELEASAKSILKKNYGAEATNKSVVIKSLTV
jgi:ATP-dependent protease ClpP protease subunit